MAENKENKMAEILVEQAYEKGYADGRIAFIKEIMKDIYEIDDCLYNDDYASGFNTAINNVIDVINKAAGDSDGRE